MVHNCGNWMRARRAGLLALAAAGLPLALFGGPAVRAQNLMHSPNIHIEPHVQSVNPTVAPHVNPNIAAKSVTTSVNPNIAAKGVTTNVGAHVHGDNGPHIAIRSMPRIGVNSTLPYVRYSPNLYPACSYAYRDSDGECRDQPLSAVNDGASSGLRGKKGKRGPRRNVAQVSDGRRLVVAEIDGALTATQADELARRHGLVRLEFAEFSVDRRDHRPVPHYRRPFG